MRKDMHLVVELYVTYGRYERRVLRQTNHKIVVLSPSKHQSLHAFCCERIDIPDHVMSAYKS